MRVQISYFGNIRAETGVKTEGYDIEPGSNLASLLETVGVERNIKDRLFGEKSVNLLLNGRNIKFLDGMDTTLSDGDQISVFPPTGGG